MEKTAGTMAVVKGSTSATAVMTAVEVDQEALCCPRCLHLLVPPVLQCAAGHLICSPCHDNLPDKNKCVSCFVTRFVPTSYSRCHAVEGILRSVRVACPNAIHGCTEAKMLCHEKAEHENKCCSKPGLQHKASVLKMGPCGGGKRGKDWEMDVSSVDRIVKVVVWHGDVVDAMKVVHEQDGKEKTDPFRGQPENKRSTICLESDEYLTGVKGHIDDYGRWYFCVRSLAFISNRRTFGPYGMEEGEQFELPAAPGGRIVGFHGRSDSYLDALGTYVKMDV